MIQSLLDIFTDQEKYERIRSKLPYMFQLAELESTRAGKIGMEVGILRERVICSMLLYFFGDSRVMTDIPATSPELDVFLDNLPISIKTITGSGFSGVKVSWTVDAAKSRSFAHDYKPSCDIILVQINWGHSGGLYYLPLEVQRCTLKNMGPKQYLKLPKPGTNPRGIEISSQALEAIGKHADSRKISIDWLRRDLEYNQFDRWVDLWAQN